MPVSSIETETLNKITMVYKLVVEGTVNRVESIKVTEVAKVVKF